MSFTIFDEAAYAIVRQSLEVLAKVSAPLTLEVEESVLCPYPQLPVVILEHAIIFIAVAFNFLCARERSQRVGLCVEQEGSVLGVNGSPLAVDGARSDQDAVGEQDGQLRRQWLQLLPVGQEVAEVAQRVASQDASVGEGHDERGLSDASCSTSCQTDQGIAVEVQLRHRASGALIDDAIGARAYPQATLTVGRGYGHVANMDGIDDFEL